MIDETVKKETLFLISVELILTAVMLAVFLIVGQFDLYVLFGGIYGAVMSSLNFFLMCLTIQKAVKSDDEKKRKTFMKFSQTIRSFALLVLLGLAIGLFKTNWIATLVPLLFPRISVVIRQAVLKKQSAASSQAKEDKTEDDE